MGFLSKLFGFGGSKPTAKQEIEPIEYNGFLIYPDPIAEGGQYRIAGKITKEVDGELQEHRFIRSDVLSSKADACELMVKKSQMFIDQSSGKIF
ncbi:HlyU family transcriptional regulator [Vibrio aphrogenes]|uniref:HlyU family transcriptional regulator n=1 Tax=Vibrio aphrogenes TaxID=1891186 RepID=UPI000B361552|nr:HlyU family transcriptional regulator [Vibrio aphrogenes]